MSEDQSDRNEDGTLKEGHQVNKGLRKVTAIERDARKTGALELMDHLKGHIQKEVGDLHNILSDPKTKATDALAASLILEGIKGQNSVSATKLIYDRIVGPLAKKLELSGSLYDFASMTKEEKIALLTELRKLRSSE